MPKKAQQTKSTRTTKKANKPKKKTTPKKKTNKTKKTKKTNKKGPTKKSKPKPSKSRSDLEREVRELKQLTQGLRSELGYLYTEILKLALGHNYTEIVAFLNPNPEEEQELWTQIQEEDDTNHE